VQGSDRRDRRLRRDLPVAPAAGFSVGRDSCIEPPAATVSCSASARSPGRSRCWPASAVKPIASPSRTSALSRWTMRERGSRPTPRSRFDGRERRPERRSVPAPPASAGGARISRRDGVIAASIPLRPALPGRTKLLVRRDSGGVQHAGPSSKSLVYKTVQPA
jgi:hypothetical protein